MTLWSGSIYRKLLLFPIYVAAWVTSKIQARIPKTARNVMALLRQRQWYSGHTGLSS
jgi:hypothetical protein